MDEKYTLLAAGSTATSAAPAHSLFGAYGGLSTLSEEAVVFLQVYASAANLRLWNSTVSNNTGFRVESGATVEWPSMRAAEASGLHLARETATNASANWTLMQRRPY